MTKTTKTVETSETFKTVDSKPTDMLVGTRDVSLSVGNKRKAKAAQPAIEEVKAVKAIPEKKDKDGNVIQEAVPAVKGVKAVPAQPAVAQEQEVHIDSINAEICKEVEARMADQGFFPLRKYGDGAPRMTKKGTFPAGQERFRLTYMAETDKPIRAALKKVKAKDGYNKVAFEALAKAKAEAQAKAKAEKKAKADEAKAKKAAEKKEEPAKKVTKEEPPKDAFDAAVKA